MVRLRARIVCSRKSKIYFEFSKTLERFVHLFLNASHGNNKLVYENLTVLYRQLKNYQIDMFFHNSERF